jgi:hypothetical protein
MSVTVVVIILPPSFSSFLYFHSCVEESKHNCLHPLSTSTVVVVVAAPCEQTLSLPSSQKHVKPMWEINTPTQQKILDY